MAPFRKHESSDQEKAAYTKLVEKADSDDNSSIEESDIGLDRLPPKKKPSIIRRITSVTVKALVVLLAAWGLTNLTQRALYVDPQSKSCSCGGTTVAEALRQGCIFTPLAIAWLPPHCIDMELSDEFDKMGPGPNGSWPYWADPQGKIAMTREEVGMLADNDGVFYTTQDWHITHCTTTWRKHYRQKETGVTIERRSNGLDHIGHCESIFRLRGGLQSIMTVAGIALDANDPGETDFDQVGAHNKPMKVKL